MSTFSAIAAMSENRVIGNLGQIPWNLPEDYRWFKQKTMGGTLVMGRKTYESIGKALPGRETLVLSRSSRLKGVTLCHDIPSLLEKIHDLPRPWWVCGGVDIYRQFLRRCEVLYLTRVHRLASGDAFFPPFEDKFELDQVIHENEDFRVERWRLLYHSDATPLEAEPWPPSGPQN